MTRRLSHASTIATAFRHATSGIVGVTLAALINPSATLASDRAPPEWKPRAVVSGLVVQVIDGDTLRVRSSGGLADVRLHGLDAPEYNQQCTRSTGVQFQCGAEATAHMIDILRAIPVACASGQMHGTCINGAGAPITCEVLDIDRKWGRPVARCFSGPTDVARELVARGYARSAYSHDYDLIAAAARFQGRGLWSGTWTDPADFRHGKSTH